jgi:hypothetical protein
MKPTVEIGFIPTFTIAYFESRWVTVPFFFESERARDLQPKKDLDALEVRSNDCALDASVDSISESIVPWLMPPKKLKELCKRNDIPLYWVIGISTTRKSFTKGLRSTNRKCSSLMPADYRKFIKNLSKIDKRSALIAKILWFLNRQFAAHGNFVTLEEILRLKIEDVSPAIAPATPWIRLHRKGINCSSLVVFSLPEYLWHRLDALIDGDSWYVFSNKWRGPLLPVHIDRYFQQARKAAGLDEVVTSLSLRPPFNSTTEQECVKQKGEPYLHEVTPAEWKLFCKYLPFLVERKGCKSAHDPRKVLNAILYHLRERCPLRRLPTRFPSWTAVDSQLRRWRKKGVIDEIINFRKSMMLSQKKSI